MKLVEIKKLKVPELKSRLKELGLVSKGLKAELVGRLWSALEEGEYKLNIQHGSTTLPHISTETAAVSSPAQSHTVYSDTSTQTDIELVGPALESKIEPEKQQGYEDSSALDGRALTPEEIGRGRAFYEFKEEIRYKRAKIHQISVTEKIEEEDPNIVKIDPYNSHLHFEVGTDGDCGHPRFWEQFPLLWSGCRLSHGVQQNRVGFEVRLEKKLLTTQLQEERDIEPIGLRVGWSVANTSLLLGEDHLSFAYDGCGKKVSHGKQEDYGEHLSVGDIIGCYASFSTDGAVELSFHKNGSFLGVAFSLDRTLLQEQPLFPHVLCRGCSVQFLLNPAAPPWYPPPPGFTSLAALPKDQRICAISAPPSKAQCEVVLMVGLPGSGKTHWAKTQINQHPEKRYKLLSTEELLACMIMSGQRDSRLQQASQCLTEVIKLAAKSPGNYIFDQCNTLFSARHYKLQLFTGFRRKVVVVFPSAEEWKRRLSKHQTHNGEQIPHSALLKLQVSCTLPEENNLLEELLYVELSQQQAQTILQEYKDEARRLLPPVHKHDKKKSHLYKKRPYPHWPPSSYNTQCTGLNGLSYSQSWSQPQRYWPETYQQGYYYDSRDLSSSSYVGHW